MKRILYIFGLLIWLAPTVTFAQEFEFGEVTVEELQQTDDKVFPEADAIILYREVKTNFGYHREFYQRVKILNEEGYSHATITIPTGAYKFEAATYNLVAGKVVRTKVNKDQIFEEEIKKDVSIRKVTFPRVVQGSIIEYRYRRDRGTFNTIYLQDDIPIKHLFVEIKNGTRVDFDVIQNPRAYIELKRNVINKVILNRAENIPAFESENYVYDLDLYQSKLMIKRDPRKFNNYKTIFEYLYERDDFKLQVATKGSYRKELQRVIGDEKDQVQQARLVYQYIKDNFTWDEYIGYIPENGTRETFSKKEGNLADINLMYISMMRSLDIVAHPVLASTRGNGMPVRPSPQAFNYIIAGVKINGETYLVDAASTYATFDMLPESLLNWEGYLFRKDGTYETYDLTKPKHSVINVIATAVIDENLVLSGKARERNTGYYAISSRNTLKNGNETDVNNLAAYKFKGFQASNVEVLDSGSMDELNDTFDYKVENAVDEIGDKLYFSPLFFLSLDTNPFIQDQRKFPIDFGFSKQINYMISTSIPEGYEVDFLPESVKYSLPFDIGSFTYQITSQNGMIQVRTKYEINSFLLSQDAYADVKEFFKVRLDKENEKVVLKRI